MRNLFRTKRRQVFTSLTFLGSAVILIGFQNCAPQNFDSSNATSGSLNSSSTNVSSSSSTSTIWNSRSGGSGSSSGGLTAGGGSGSTFSSGSSSSGSGAILGGGSGGGSSSGSLIIGGGSGSTGNVNDTTFRITQQPQSVNVKEGERFEMSVVLIGGKSPYFYQWFKDGVALGDNLGTYSFYTDEANSYKKAGTYYVVARDSAGLSIQSSVVRVTIEEPKVGCTEGSYFTFTDANYDKSYGYFPEYLDPAAPRPKFLLHSSYDVYNFLYPNRAYTSLKDFNVTKNLAYMEKTWISCRTAIPRIHTPTANPSYSSSFLRSSSRYADNSSYVYQGKIEFECRNKKLQFVANTCKWVPASSSGF